MNEKPIAIIATSITFAFDWLDKRYERRGHRITANIVNREYTVNEQRYIIVTKPEHALGFEFKAYMVCPDFQSLEQVVRDRVSK